MTLPPSAPKEFPIRQVLGAGKLLWAVRQSLRQKHSRYWRVVTATVEGCEVLRFASNAGWLSVSYSYAFDGEVFSGELRKGMIAREASALALDPKTIEFLRHFPAGSQITVRVNPKTPNKSVGEAWPVQSHVG